MRFTYHIIKKTPRIFHSDLTYLTHYAGLSYRKVVWNFELFEIFVFLNGYLLHPCTNHRHLHRLYPRLDNVFSRMCRDISDRFALIELLHSLWTRGYQMFRVVHPRHYFD